MPDTEVLERTDIIISVSDPWNVVMHNDDVTPMEFVIFVLMTIFNKSPDDSVKLTLTIHTSDSAVISSYSCFDEADQKVSEVTDMAKKYGYPLRATAEK